MMTIYAYILSTHIDTFDDDNDNGAANGDVVCFCFGTSCKVLSNFVFIRCIRFPEETQLWCDSVGIRVKKTSKYCRT